MARFSQIAGGRPRRRKPHSAPQSRIPGRAALEEEIDGDADQGRGDGDEGFLRPLEEAVPVRLTARLAITPFVVPHRQEYSEVVGFRIDGPVRSVLYLPDIDSWEDWEEMGERVEEWIASVDVAYLDGTFYSDGEIPGRDMSNFPHPFIVGSMKRFQALPLAERAKVRFIHLNHTNPALWPDTQERRRVSEQGFHVAREGERFDL